MRIGISLHSSPSIDGLSITIAIRMLAARDQENLVHGHQAAAASKPLNQGNRQLAPKTPGNKVPKTPAFKLPLNDENVNGGIGGGKAPLKANGTGKNAFVTPMGRTHQFGGWEGGG